MGRLGLILDFDGTIVDSGPIFTACMNELGEEFDYAKIEAGSQLREKSAREIFTHHLNLSPENLKAWTERFKALLKVKMVNAIPFRGMKEVFNRLAGSYRVGILTSNSAEVVDSIFQRHGFVPVDFIHYDVPILEKDRAMEELLKEQRLPPDETVYIGDEVRDIDACRKTGMRIISVTWGFNSRAALERQGPDYLVNSPEELWELLAGGRLEL